VQASSSASGEGGRTPGRGLFAALFIDAVGSGLWLPFNLIFFTRAQGVSLGSVGIALTLGALAGLVVGQLSGGVLDRVGPHRALAVSNLTRALIFGVYPFVHHPLEVALVVAVVSSGDRVFWTANYPYLSSWARGRDVDKLFGTIGVLQLVGLGLGAAAAGTFANDTAALHSLAWLNGASFAVSGILLARQPARPIAVDAAALGEPVGRPRSAWGDRPYLLLCGVQILLVLLNSSYVIILPLLILRNFHGPTWLVGLSIVVANAVLAGCQKPVLRFTRTRPRRTAILAALPVYVVSFGLLVGLDHHVGEGLVVAAVLIAAALGGFGESLSITLMISAADAAAPADSRGRYSAAFQTSWGLAEVIAPLLFTRLLLGGNAVLWLTLAVLAVLTAPVVIRASRSLPPSVLAVAGNSE
jgi:MFS family permease